MNNHEKISDFSIGTPKNSGVEDGIQTENEEISSEEKNNKEFGPSRSKKEVAEAQKKLAELIEALKESIKKDLNKKDEGSAQ
jgi:hypothetical protein